MNDLVFPPYALEFYACSIDEEARLAVRSFLAFGIAVTKDDSEAEAAGYLHEALTHCAALSRYFWPSGTAKGFAQTRAKLLRKRYRLDDQSALADRGLRNALEHFDERIDEWLTKNPVGPIMASPIIADQNLTDDGVGHAFKVIDPKHDVLVILGQKFEFGSLAREVSRIAMADDEAWERSWRP